MNLEEIKYTTNGLISALFDKKKKPEMLKIEMCNNIECESLNITFEECGNKIADLLYKNNKRFDTLKILNDKNEIIHIIDIV